MPRFRGSRVTWQCHGLEARRQRLVGKHIWPRKAAQPKTPDEQTRHPTRNPGTRRTTQTPNAQPRHPTHNPDTRRTTQTPDAQPRHPAHNPTRRPRPAARERQEGRSHGGRRERATGSVPWRRCRWKRPAAGPERGAPAASRVQGSGFQGAVGQRRARPLEPSGSGASAFGCSGAGAFGCLLA